MTDPTPTTVVLDDTLLARVVEHSTEFVAVIGEDLHTLFLNDAGRALVGIGPEQDVRATTIADFVAPSDRERIERDILPALLRDGRWDDEISLRDWTTAASIAVDASAFVVRHSDPPRGAAFACIARDIRAQRQVEEELRQSAERYQRLYRSIPDPTNIWQRREDAFILVDYNNASDEASEGRIQARLGETLTELFATEPQVIADVTQASTEQGTVRREMHYRRRRTGYEGVYLFSYVFVPPDMVMQHAVDVTAQRQSEAALRESEMRFRALSEGAWEGVIVHDKGQLVVANQAFAEMLGYRLDELIGWSLLDLSAPEDRRRVAKSVAINLTEPYEAMAVRKDGTRFPVQVRGRIATYQGRPVRVVVVRDLTTYKAVEAELRRYAHRLADVQERERQRIARELHDEVGQHLTGLSLLLDAAARDQQLAATRLQEAQTIVMRLVADVRDLSLQLRPALLDDLGLIPALAWLIERYARQTGVDVHFEPAAFDLRLRPEVETAAFRIVEEALSNVARHSGVTRATLFTGVRQSAFLVEVADLGRGFDRDSVPDASGGLVSMQQRAIAVGGVVEIHSRPDAGTRIRAEFPLPAQTLV